MSSKSEKSERKDNQCAVCNNEDLNFFEVPEMQIGLRENFEYGQCPKCGCITRLSEIRDLRPYYAGGTYSTLWEEKPANSSWITEWLRKERDRTLFTNSLNPLGRLLSFFTPEVAASHKLVGFYGPKLSNRVLDIGCGGGHLVRRMAEVGFRNLTGIDLFMPERAICDQENLKIIKTDLTTFPDQCFDLIMMHHSFEHLPDPSSHLKHIYRMLPPGGMVLIRQPLSDSEAFRRYGPHWFQLDAPRHAAIHSVKSMEWLVEKCGMKIERIVWDSTDLQFWASEQYAMGIPLFSETSYFCNPAQSPFSTIQIKHWKKEAAKLNRVGLGDQAAFYLRKG